VKFIGGDEGFYEIWEDNGVEYMFWMTENRWTRIMSENIQVESDGASLDRKRVDYIADDGEPFMRAFRDQAELVKLRGDILQAQVDIAHVARCKSIRVNGNCKRCDSIKERQEIDPPKTGKQVTVKAIKSDDKIKEPTVDDLVMIAEWFEHKEVVATSSGVDNEFVSSPFNHNAREMRQVASLIRREIASRKRKAASK